MSSGLPTTPEEPRIVPFRVATIARPDADVLTQRPDAAPSPIDSTASTGAGKSRDAARHYLKFMLPAIPVAAFVATFVASLLAQAHAASHPARAADPTMPFLAALVLGAITGALCVHIYFGYVRVSAPRSGAGSPPA